MDKSDPNKMFHVLLHNISNSVASSNLLLNLVWRCRRFYALAIFGRVHFLQRAPPKIASTEKGQQCQTNLHHCLLLPGNNRLFNYCSSSSSYIYHITHLSVVGITDTVIFVHIRLNTKINSSEIFLQ